MSIKFGTDEWAKAAMAALNSAPAYKKAAAKWEGDFYFVVPDGNGAGNPITMYMDLWHGDCRDAFLVTDPSAKSPAFVMTAPIAVWQLVFEGKLDPIKGMMSKKLTLQGNKMKILKAPKAAVEMVNCCASIDTEW